jgi:hypothetical protein
MKRNPAKAGKMDFLRSRQGLGTETAFLAYPNFIPDVTNPNRCQLKKAVV